MAELDKALAVHSLIRKLYKPEYIPRVSAGSMAWIAAL
jgi:hypothetical protein